MAKVLENIKDIVWIKNELRQILIAIGVEPNDDFSTYADEFTSAIDIINSKTSQILGE